MLDLSTQQPSIQPPQPGAPSPRPRNLPPPPPGRRPPASYQPPGQTPKQPRKQPGRGGALNGILAGVLAFLIVVLVGLAVATTGYVAIAASLPPASELAQRVNQAGTTRIYDRNGVLLNAPLAPDDPTAGLRRRIGIDEISPYLLQATVATEDANFYKHRGVDPIALSARSSGPL